MSRALAGFEGTWRLVSLALLIIVVAEAWYVSRLSNQLNDYRGEVSKSLETHLSDQYVIARLKRARAAEMAQLKSTAAPTAQP